MRSVLTWPALVSTAARPADGLDHQRFGLSGRERDGNGTEGGGLVFPDVVAACRGRVDPELRQREGACACACAEVREQDRGAAIGALEHRFDGPAGDGCGGL